MIHPSHPAGTVAAPLHPGPADLDVLKVAPARDTSTLDVHVDDRVCLLIVHLLASSFRHDACQSGHLGRLGLDVLPRPPSSGLAPSAASPARLSCAGARLHASQPLESTPITGMTMMLGKRKLVRYGDEDDHHNGDVHIIQEPFLGHQAKRRRTLLDPDHVAALSDELLIRIFSFLDEKTLLSISPVSRRFNRITSDSQLWRPHYYLRFILPRAHRIPGFRTGSTRGSSKLRYSAGKSIWADGGWGRRGGLVGASATGPSPPVVSASAPPQQEVIDWKKQYRLRHNWARGRCAVDEVQVRHVEHDARLPVTDWQTLVKVVEGLAVTADGTCGLRAWDLRTRRLVAQTALSGERGRPRQPSCLAVDDVLLTTMRLVEAAVGFEDGTFELWRVDVERGSVSLAHRHARGYQGALEAIAYAHPYLVAASRRGAISVFAFDDADVVAGPCAKSGVSGAKRRSAPGGPWDDKEQAVASPFLSSPRLLTSLRSESTRKPLALSIRRTSASVVASIAYTFDAPGGWSIGIQDLDIRTSGGSGADVVACRVAYTLPTETRRSGTRAPSASSSVPNPRGPRRAMARPPPPEDEEDDGPTRLCYSHPYLLATLPDNTLVLHLCTASASSLCMSPGIRLWGHTSGISDAEITPRGKAVSVSTRGDEIRVWELEGRVGGSSVEVRPRPRPRVGDDGSDADAGDRKNRVGFDDEVVVVLKEGRDGGQSLVVYDFT